MGLKDAQSAYRDIALFPVCNLTYPYDISTVFPGPVVIDPETASSALSSSFINRGDETGVQEILTIVDYRYSRFVLDPRTGLFSMIRFVAHFQPI